MAEPFLIHWRNKLAQLYSWATSSVLVTVGTILLTGGQIAFPATDVPSADPNTLDDYEEGTFTPGISFNGGTTGITYGAQTGTYTKIGNFVHAFGSVTLTSKGSSTGFARMTGFPFSAVTPGQPHETYYDLINLDVAGGYYSVVATSSGVGPLLVEVGDNVASALITDADFSNTTKVSINAEYRI